MRTLIALAVAVRDTVTGRRSLTRRVDPAARGRRHDRDASLPGHYVPSAKFPTHNGW